jgi:hypothetical protein
MINSKVHRISLGQVIVAIYIWHAAMSDGLGEHS